MQNAKRMIVHIVHREKFSNQYINFMKMVMTDYEHFFILKDAGFPLNLVDTQQVIYVKTLHSLHCGACAKLLKQCDKVIVTGVFLLPEMSAFFNRAILKKTYLHFWGGDYYWAQSSGIKQSIKRPLLHYLIRHCAGTLNLIDGDVQTLCALFPNNVPHYVAQMPRDPFNTIDHDRILREAEKTDATRIIVGNSATPENDHAGAFALLQKFKTENVQVCCPLSYGEEKYKDTVLKEGQAQLGSAFSPMLEYQPLQDYFRFLASCEVGVFNNNRQQALGNIWQLLRFGKKVYLREDTSMWPLFQELGIKVFPVHQISRMDLEQFLYLSEEDRKNNMTIAAWRLNPERAKQRWSEVLAL